MAGEIKKITHMDKEKREWLDFTNFNIWQVLKLVSGGKGHVRGMIGIFRGSNTALELTVNNLVRWGLLSENKERAWPFKRTLVLTKDGAKMMGLLDEIGEVVKGIRMRRAEGMKKEEVRG